jgi:AI-2 transport protein TqsA
MLRRRRKQKVVPDVPSVDAEAMAGTNTVNRPQSLFGKRVGFMRDLKINTILLAFLALIGAGFVIFILREMLLAVVVAVTFSLLFKPMVRWLRFRGVPLPACVLIVMLCVLGILMLLGFILFTGVQSVVIAAPRYQVRLNQILQDITVFIDSSSRQLGRAGPSFNLADEIQFSSVAAFLAGSVGTVLSFFENMVLILLFLVFLLSGSEEFQEKIARAFSSEDSLRVTGVLTQINTQVRRYIIVKTLINIGVGLLTAVIMLAFGIDFALLIGLLTFFLNYIPNFGALIATVLPVSVTLLQTGSLGLTAAITGLLIVAHSIIGNFVEPELLGRSLRLSPLLVLISLIFWGWMWGIIGAVLAVPITSILKIICQNVESLRPLAILMSDTAER